MNLKIKLLFVLSIVSFFLTNESSAQSQTANLEAKEIVKKIDDLYRSKSSYSIMEMEIVTPHWQRTLKMKIWTEGLDKTFIRITEPAKEKGVATLRIKDEMWNYLPKTNKVIKIPPSMMTSSWMGSDFNNDDLVGEFTLLDDYHYKLITPEDAKEGLVYVEARPKEDLPVVWGKIILAVRQTDYIPLWEKYYDEKNELMRTFSFSDITEFGGKKIPAVMELVPQNEEGHKTVLRYLKAEFDISFDRDIFSLRNLRSPN